MLHPGCLLFSRTSLLPYFSSPSSFLSSVPPPLPLPHFLSCQSLFRNPALTSEVFISLHLTANVGALSRTRGLALGAAPNIRDGQADAGSGLDVPEQALRMVWAESRTLGRQWR